MKKYFCYNCQQQIEPKRILLWRFCSQCKHLITDKGEGFYRVCENCGANMPTDAAHCPKCGFSTGLPDNHLYPFFEKNVLFEWLFRVCLFIACVLILTGVLYISFYVVFAILVIGLLFFIINLFLFSGTK